MPVFRYDVVDAQGKRSSGALEAPGERDVRETLQQQGLYVIKVGAAARAPSDRGRWWEWSVGPVPRKEVLAFWISLGSLYRAGVTLSAGLRLLGEQTTHPGMRRVVARLGKALDSGASLSASLAQHPKAFPEQVVSMIEAGELSGKLDTVIEQVAVFLEREIELRAKIVSSLAYPAFVVTALLAGIIILVTIPIPKFVEMFNEMRMPLPKPTLILYRVGIFLKSRGVELAASLAAGGIGIRWLRTKPAIRLATDRALLGIPLLGGFIRTSEAARFSLVFETLFMSGVPVERCLEIGAKVQSNRAIRQAVGRIQASVEQGKPLAESLERERIFPPLVPAMVAVGENAGRLPESFRVVYRMLNRRLDSIIQRVITLMAPMILIFLAGAVGFVLSSIMLPLFRMSRSINR